MLILCQWCWSFVMFADTSSLYSGTSLMLYFIIHDKTSTSSLYTVTWSQYAFILMLPHLMERWHSITSDSLFWYAHVSLFDGVWHYTMIRWHHMMIFWHYISCISTYMSYIMIHDMWKILFFTRIVQVVSIGFWFYGEMLKNLIFIFKNLKIKLMV